ncbi:MAG: hypothetical protein V4623_07845 [Pseudomonadota bacterium]
MSQISFASPVTGASASPDAGSNAAVERPPSVEIDPTSGDQATPEQPADTFSAGNADDAIPPPLVTPTASSVADAH